MKAVILAGGLGTRISEESHLKPKPMIEIGARPILWHIMKIYSAHGINDFIVCCGYKGYIIKEYFVNYFLHNADVTFDLRNNRTEIHNAGAEPWRVTLIDTGEETMTGGRLLKVKNHLENEDFCFTYGDGVGNIDIPKLIQFHKSHGRIATVTATQAPGRFGALAWEGERIHHFAEKPLGDNHWINGGFFVLSPKVFSYLKSSEDVWERGPLESIARDGQLAGYKHYGFWQPMDTLRDKNHLEDLWKTGDAPWKIW